MPMRKAPDSEVIILCDDHEPLNTRKLPDLGIVARLELVQDHVRRAGELDREAGDQRARQVLIEQQLHAESFQSPFV